MNSTKLRVLLGLAAVVAAVSFGCKQAAQGPTTYAVTGTVTLDGAPVSGATVTFAPAGQAGTPAVGTTDASGKYTLKTGTKEGAAAGDYIVGIQQFESAAGGAGGGSSIEMPADYDPNKAPEESGAKQLLPAMYASPATSGFKATVTTDPTKNVFDFAMKSEGSAAGGKE